MCSLVAQRMRQRLTVSCLLNVHFPQLSCVVVDTRLTCLSYDGRTKRLQISLGGTHAPRMRLSLPRTSRYSRLPSELGDISALVNKAGGMSKVIS